MSEPEGKTVVEVMARVLSKRQGERLLTSESEEAANEQIAALTQAGFQICPIEPTAEMIADGETAVENNCDETQDSYSSWTIIHYAGAARDAYKAMLAVCATTSK